MTFVAPRIVNDVSYVTRIKLCVAGAVLGEGQVSLFVAGAVLGEIWKDSLSSKCCIFQYKKCSSGARKVTSVARRVAD